MTALSHHYRIETDTPLTFGAGKPLDFGIGGDTLDFPRPSTVAGALRAATAVRAGRSADPFDAEAVNAAVGPPLLLRIARDPGKATEQTTVFLPRPADAFYVGDIERSVVPLVPKPTGQGMTDLDPLWDGLQLPTLLQSTRAKPARAPAWWSLQLMREWLERGVAATVDENEAHRENTLASLAQSRRTHVAIDPARAAAKDGALFRTTGVDFGGRRSQLDAGILERFAIGVSSSAAGLSGLNRRLGGEGRPVRLYAANALLPAAPEVGIRSGSVFRVVLISPAIFPDGGWRPCWIDPQSRCGSMPGAAGSGLQIELIAAQVERAQHHSGWRLDTAGRPGPGAPLRAVPAGSVYWFKALADLPAQAFWNRSLCADQWAASGWGFCLWGTA